MVPKISIVPNPPDSPLGREVVIWLEWFDGCMHQTRSITYLTSDGVQDWRLGVRRAGFGSDVEDLIEAELVGKSW